MEEFYIRNNNRWDGPFSEEEFNAGISGMEKVIYWKPEFCPNGIFHPALCSHYKVKEVIPDASPNTAEQEKKPEPTTEIPDPEKEKPGPISEIQEPVSETPENKTESSPPEIIIPPSVSKPSAPPPETPEIQNKKPVAETPKPTEEIPEPVSKSAEDNDVKKSRKPVPPPVLKSSTPSSESEQPPPVSPPTEKSYSPGEDKKRNRYLIPVLAIILVLLLILPWIYVSSRLKTIKYQYKVLNNHIEQIDEQTSDIGIKQDLLQQKIDSLGFLITSRMNTEKDLETEFSPNPGQKALLGLTPSVMRKARKMMQLGTDYSKEDFLINYPTNRYYAVVISYADLAFALLQRQHLYSLGFNNAKILVFKGLYGVSIEDAESKSDPDLKIAYENWKTISENKMLPFLRKY